MEDDQETTEHEEETPQRKMTYEELREFNIRRNNKMMKEMGLDELKPQKKKAPVKKRKPPARNEPRAEPERRSKRTRGETPDYTHEKIDRFGEELDMLAERGGRQQSQAEQMQDSGLEQEALELQEELREKRKEQRARVAASIGASASGEEGWHQFAVKRWGESVDLASPESWQAYVTSRLTTPPPPSPMNLLQVPRL